MTTTTTAAAQRDASRTSHARERSLTLRDARRRKVATATAPRAWSADLAPLVASPRLDVERTPVR